MLSFVSGSCVVDKGESNIVWAFSVALQLKSLHNFHMCSKIAFIVFYTKPFLSKSLVNLWKLTKDKVICVFLLSTCIKIDINLLKELDLVLLLSWRHVLMNNKLLFKSHMSQFFLASGKQLKKKTRILRLDSKLLTDVNNYNLWQESSSLCLVVS